MMTTPKSSAIEKSNWNLRKSVNAILVVFTVFCLCLPVRAYLSKKDVSLFGYRSFVVLTGSMSPAFGAGSYVIVKQKAVEEIEVGDVITYYLASGAILTHRVVDVIEGEFVTKGDANNIPDNNHVAAERIIGVVVFSVNGLGSFITTLRQPEVLTAAGVGLCIALLAAELYERAVVNGRHGKQ